MKKLFTISLLVFATGCLTFDTINHGLESLREENISEAFKALGYPDNKETFGKETVYYWRKTYSESGNTYRCRITIAADSKNIVTKTSYSGQWGACKKYAEVLDRYLKTPDEPI